MQFGSDRPKRRLVSLTPMIDVVFLLLVFFMLASRFADERAVALTSGGGASSSAAAWEGPPRLLTVSPDGVAFNGAPGTLATLGAVLTAQGVEPDQTILVRPIGDADMQRLTDALDALAEGGFTRPVLTP